MHLDGTDPCRWARDGLSAGVAANWSHVRACRGSSQLRQFNPSMISDDELLAYHKEVTS